MAGTHPRPIPPLPPHVPEDKQDRRQNLFKGGHQLKTHEDLTGGPVRNCRQWKYIYTNIYKELVPNLSRLCRVQRFLWAGQFRKARAPYYLFCAPAKASKECQHKGAEASRTGKTSHAAAKHSKDGQTQDQEGALHYNMFLAEKYKQINTCSKARSFFLSGLDDVESC